MFFKNNQKIYFPVFKLKLINGLNYKTFQTHPYQKIENPK